MGIRVSQKKLKIEKEWCKGCSVCVEFCPKNVLALESSKAEIINPDACIGCGLCEMRCPDYAIFLEEEGDQND